MKQIRLAFALLAFYSAPAFAVIGGAPAPDLMQHTVMVLSKKGSLCSGALIAPRVVLTAAHCVTDKSGYAVHVRTHDNQPVLIEPREVIVHPGYVADAIKKRVPSIDLAVLRLDTDLPPEFRPVGLSDAMPRADQIVTLGGYGLVDERNPASNGKFNAVTMQVIEPYGQSKILLWLKGEAISGTALQRGGCHGDSGGPIFHDNRLVAITTWTTGPQGRDCGDMTQAALIAPQRAWIEQFLK